MDKAAFAEATFSGKGADVGGRLNIFIYSLARRIDPLLAFGSNFPASEGVFSRDNVQYLIEIGGTPIGKHGLLHYVFSGHPLGYVLKCFAFSHIKDAQIPNAEPFKNSFAPNSAKMNVVRDRIVLFFITVFLLFSGAKQDNASLAKANPRVINE
jgi:hypothetical protein